MNNQQLALMRQLIAKEDRIRAQHRRDKENPVLQWKARAFRGSDPNSIVCVAANQHITLATLDPNTI